MDTGLGIVLLKFLIGLVIVLSLTGAFDPVLKSAQSFFRSSDSNAEPGKSPPQRTRAVDVNATP